MSRTATEATIGVRAVHSVHSSGTSFPSAEFSNTCLFVFPRRLPRCWVERKTRQAGSSADLLRRGGLQVAGLRQRSLERHTDTLNTTEMPLLMPSVLLKRPKHNLTLPSYAAQSQWLGYVVGGELRPIERVLLLPTSGKGGTLQMAPRCHLVSQMLAWSGL